MKRVQGMQAMGVALCAAVAAGWVRADLVVYEGFDCAATNNAPLTGLAGATSIGFQGGSVWTNANVSRSSFRTNGLALATASPGLLARSGGAAYLRSGNVVWETGNTSRTLGVTANTIWGSFLFRRETLTDYSGLSLMVTQGRTTSDTEAGLNVAAEEWGKTRVGARVRGTEAELGGTAIDTGTTYLMLFKATNLNAAAGNSALRVWVLTATQFQTFRAGGISETELDAATLGTGADHVLQRGECVRTSSPRPTFKDGDYLMLWSKINDIIQWAPSYSVSGFFDELRISNASLDETLPLGPGIAVDNALGGEALTPTSANLRGTVLSPGNAAVDAYVFWGATDGGATPTAWQHSTLVASGLAGSAAVGTNLVHALTGLARDTAVLYRYAVSNAVDGLVWAPATAAAAGTFSTQGYGRRVPIDFDGYTGIQPLTNFTALVRFTTAELGSAANGTGRDLRFTDVDGNPLNYEVETWNATDGWNVWLQVPVLTAATRVWAYVGNGDVAGYPSYYARKGGAWAPEFRGVWHLGESVANNQNGGVHADSTANNLEAIQRGNAPVAGMVGKAQRTEKANNEYLVVTNRLSAALDVGSQFTLSAWVRWEGAAPTSNSRMFARKNAFTDPHGFEIIQLYQASAPQHQFWVRGAGTSGTLPTFQCTTVNPTSTTWWHMAVRFNGTTATLYKDGGVVDSGTILASANNDVELYFGNFGALTGAFNGDFDEVRLESGLRSADWIKAVWKNMADNAGFLTYGTVESLGGSLILVR